MMRWQRFEVKKDSQASYNREVAPWEVPVLTLVFDEGNIQPTDDYETVNRPYPDPAVEFDRLSKAYPTDPATGIPYVVQVYGTGQRGINALAKAIKEAREADAEYLAEMTEADPLVA